MDKDQLKGIATTWKAEIREYEKCSEKWVNRGKKVVKRYLDERTGDDESRDTKFNILWSNVETIFPAAYAKMPKAEVSRRHQDRDPAGRVASIILERCLEYETEKYADFHSGMSSAILDRLLPGRGTAWVRYQPTFGQRAIQITEDDVSGDYGEKRGEEQTEDYLEHECAPVDYVHWEDFGHCVSRTWEEVPGIWRRVYMSKSELKERFGELAKDYKIDDIPLDAVPEEYKDKSDDGQQFKKACIYEIWDKSKKRAIWIHKNVDVPLDVRDDPLRLDGFYPCPKPLFATTSTNSLLPVPDYCMYQDQAQELDLLTQRIDSLARAVKVVGVYDASQDGIKRMLNEGVNNTMIPVDTWAMFAEKGGIKGVVDWLPLDQVIQALDYLYQAREQIKQTIYEITGLSDIVRGATQASETATAQQIKANFASLRIKKLQNNIAYFAQELMRIKAEIICNFYSDETILGMASVQSFSEQDQQVIPQALELLRNSVSRDFRIDVSVDSMVEMDEEAEKQGRVDFLNATGAFLEKSLPVATQIPELAPLIGEMLMFGVRGFKVGRTIEGVFDEAVEAMKQPKPEQPDPEAQKVQAEMQAKQAEMQMKQQQMQAEQQMKQQEAMAEHQLEQQKTQAELQTDREKQQAELALRAQEIKAEHELDVWEAQQQAELKKQQAQQVKKDA